MQDLLTKGIDENGKIRDKKTHKFKNSPLGKIPEEWEVVRLGEIVEYLRDGSHGTHENVENGIYFLSAKDINDGKVLFPKDSRFISEKDYRFIMKEFEFKKGDILLTIVGTIGKVAYIRGNEPKFTIQRSVAIIRTKSSVDFKYIYYFLQSNYFKSQLELKTNASAQGGVYLNSLSNLLIFLPNSIGEQKRIASVLSQIDETIEKETAYKEKLRHLKKGLMEDLLTGKVRVKV